MGFILMNVPLFSFSGTARKKFSNLQLENIRVVAIYTYTWCRETGESISRIKHTTEYVNFLFNLLSKVHINCK